MTDPNDGFDSGPQGIDGVKGQNQCAEHHEHGGAFVGRCGLDQLKPQNPKPDRSNDGEMGGHVVRSWVNRECGQPDDKPKISPPTYLKKVVFVGAAQLAMERAFFPPPQPPLFSSSPSLFMVVSFDIPSIIDLATRSFVLPQISTTLLYFSPWVTKPDAY